MSRRNLFWLLGIASVAVFGLAVSYSAPTKEKDKDYELVRLMVDVLHEVRQKYVVEIGPDRERKLVEDMINGGLERLDPHSQYINPKDYKRFDSQSEGKFGGVGIQVGYDRDKRNQLTVISPMVGTPAYEKGILAGDIIAKIDGKPTDSMRMSEAVDMIQGTPGTKVTLTVLREGEKKPLDVAITRAIIKVPSVLGDRRKPGKPAEWDFMIDRKERLGYIRLTNFGKNSYKEVKAALEELKKDGVRGVVLDLRGNPGGLLDVSAKIANLFLAEGKIVSTKGRNHKEETFTARSDRAILPNADEVPMAVLINKGSASASEIVSAALQDHKRAIVVGERSYGKGSVQNVILLENDTSALKLTTAGYWRPSGKNIHRYPDKKDFEAAKIDPDEWGVKPDKGFEVKLTTQDLLEYAAWRNQRDVVRTKPAPETKDKNGKPRPEFKDKVLEKALEYLKKEAAKIVVPVKRDA